MEVATLSSIKKELRERSSEELINYCLKMAKFKKDNKELLNYLLFEAYDEENFISAVKDDIEEMFFAINLSSVYYAKKSIRKILRFVSKQIRYSGIKQTEVELLIFFCLEFRKLALPFYESKVLLNLYERQLFNINKALNTLDEDLQFDFQAALDEISRPLPNRKSRL